MFQSVDVRIASAAPPAVPFRGWVGWLCTSNPFYVLSAGLFLVGLRLSFGDPSAEGQTWALMSGLAGYTQLLAVTAYLLVRFGNVWDDVRTVLLLVVLLFLATSVTFDEVLVLDPMRGYICYIVGLFFSIAVSEGLLRGIRLALPALFRVPYYLILSLFFLYPLALRPLLAEGPRSEALTWGLFAFSPLAGLVFLTLLPAIRRGPDSVRDNGSPWRWPLYPWVLFGLLGLAVPARSLLLCWSMQLLDVANMDHVLFGPFFLVPFGLALAVLLLEANLAAPRRTVPWAALTLPFVLVGLMIFGHRDDPIYRDFLARFAAGVCDPLAATLLASACFFIYSVLRRAPLSLEALTAALIMLAFVGPDTLETHELSAPRTAPLLAAAALQMAVGVCRRLSWRCLLGWGLLAVAALTLVENVEAPFWYGPLALHLLMFAALGVGALFDDPFASLLRMFGALLVFLGCQAAILMSSASSTHFAPILLLVYPPIMATLLLWYGWRLRHGTAITLAVLMLAMWSAIAGWKFYCLLRQIIGGLNYLLLSLSLFAVALFVSLRKSAILSRRKFPLSALGFQATLEAEQRQSGNDAVQQEINQIRE